MTKKRRSAAHSSSAARPSSSQQASSSPSSKATSSQTQSQPARAQAQQPRREKRSIAYIIAVAYVILHGLFWTAATFATYRAQVDRYPVLFGLLIASSLASVAAGLGMWFWKRWSGYLYLATGIATGILVTMLSGSLWLALGSFMPVIVVIYIVYPKLVE